MSSRRNGVSTRSQLETTTYSSTGEGVPLKRERGTGEWHQSNVSKVVDLGGFNIVCVFGSLSRFGRRGCGPHLILFIYSHARIDGWPNAG